MAKDVFAKLWDTVQIVGDVSRKTGVDSRTVEAVMDACFNDIYDKVTKGMTVQVTGFGTFRLKHMGQRVQIQDIRFPELTKVSPEHFKISFMACADLRRRTERQTKKILERKRRHERDDYWSEPEDSD